MEHTTHQQRWNHGATKLIKSFADISSSVSYTTPDRNTNTGYAMLCQKSALRRTKHY
jgi:hypothetical protein